MEYILVVILVVIICGIICFAGFKMISNLGKKNIQGAGNETKEEGEIINKYPSTQGLLPYDEIADDMIRVGSRYRAVVECSSINYHLASETEQVILEDSFKTMFDAMDSTFAFYVQTRELDTRSMVDRFKEDYKKLLETNSPACKYAKQFIETFERANLKNVVIKKKYLILTSDEIFDPKLTSQDKNDMAAEQLNRRVNAAMSKLNSMGLNCHRLDTEELVELMRLSINKRSGASLDAIKDGEFTTDMVQGIVEPIDRQQATVETELLVREFYNQVNALGRRAGLSKDEMAFVQQLENDAAYLKTRYTARFNEVGKDGVDFYRNYPDNIVNKDNQTLSTPIKTKPKQETIQKPSFNINKGNQNNTMNIKPKNVKAENNKSDDEDEFFEI